jgi:hypothetical protein
MWLFLIVGHWEKILPQTQKGLATAYMCVLCMDSMVYRTLFPPVSEICARLADNFCQ